LELTSHSAKAPSNLRTPELKVLERSFGSFGPKEWDDFVLGTGGSFLGSWAVIKARRLVANIRLLEFHAPCGLSAPLKVGQCAVLVKRGRVTFLDRICLKPAREHLWDECFRLATERFRAEICQYGSHWNQEPRFEISASRDGVAESILEDQFHIDLIDLSDWPNFEAYLRGVSENVRRDYRKAKCIEAKVETRQGLAAVRDVFALVRLRAEVMRKNSLRASLLKDYFIHVAKLAILGRSGFITTLRMNDKCYSAFFGIEFGSNLYYISGGTTNNHHGFGSYLFLSLIEKWFAEHPSGKFVMGFCSGHRDESTYSSGALLYRRKLRVKSVDGLDFQLRIKPVPASQAGGEPAKPKLG
jgi:Acetyltransferase (GNAT) domain